MSMPPPPPADAALTPLAKELAGRIAACGPISLHDYMEACLYDPEHGYYRSKSGIGQGGDFITAPEISQVFGELIGLWAGEVWRQMGEPAPVRLVELGPGRGTLMADALRALKILPHFLASATVHLIETSKPLEEAQRAALANVPLDVFWDEGLKDVPSGPVILIANEFLDCLPVRQVLFEAAQGAWRERMVTFENGAFRIVPGSFVRPLEAPCAAVTDIEDGAVFEDRPAIGGLIGALAQRKPLAALIIDYGYARPSLGDTVQAVKHHRFTGLFDAPGESDITAHVDFLSLKRNAMDAAMKTFGPMPMGEWLLRLGLEARVQQLLGRVSEDEANDIRRRALRLVDPAQMGVLFKVLVLTNGIAAAPPPF